MASSSTHRASSSSTSTTVSVSRNYDVFLSFTGCDVRKNFIDHLYTTLTAYGVVTFRDDEEIEKGGDIASDLFRAIEESTIFLIVFSKNYAYSRWCLNELVKIIEVLKIQKERTVLPIFYHVDPSDVRNQRGSFGDALAHHGRHAIDREKKEMIEKWRAALIQAANLAGWHVDDQYETEVIQEMVNIIMRRLNHQPLNVGKNIVGMNVRLKKLKLLMNTQLNEVRVVGIYGTGGAGKTTIAKAIYNEISYQYDGSSFLRNIKEKSKSGMLQLQQELLHGILKGNLFKINNIDEGTSMIKRCLSSNKVLVIFDDVDELRQLEYLAEEKEWFEMRSTIIITSRDKQVLAQYGANILYEVPKLYKEEAIELFSLWAFKQSLPKEAYKNISYSIIDYANGLPLALKILGASLFGKKISEWRSALCKLEIMPHMEIHNVLKISFDGLDEVDKGIFLDVACFFIGNGKDFVSRILGPHAEHGIATLDDRCLINISKNRLDIHDLIQQMAWEIIRQECPQDPGRRSRLWDSNAYHVLTRNMGTLAIEGLFLDRCKFNPLQITIESFKEMNRLRLLKIHNPQKELFLEEQLPSDFEFSSYELTYLHWDGYPLESLPMNFHAKNLVDLSLRSSKIKQLWSGHKLHEKLKVIDLSYTVHLIEIPDFSSVPNLESLTLEGCVDLEVLPRGIYKWKRLRKLSCNGCSKLKRFPKINGNMRKLRVLDLSGTAIMDLPSSITRLNGLGTLLLKECSKLHKFPIHICQLSSLKVLDLGGSNVMEGGIPSDICLLSSLQKLNLGGGYFNSLPASINQFSRLKALNLSHCNNLEQIPVLPSSLRLLDARCSNRTSSRASFLPLHSLVNCFSRAKDWERTSISDSSYRGKGTCIVLSGSDRIPEWIMNQRNSYFISTKLPQNWHQSNEFLGFAIFCVYVPLDDDESAHGSENEQKYANSYSLKCYLGMLGDGLGSRSVGTCIFESSCFCYKEDKDIEDNIESVPGQMLVFCYSKADIGERFHADEWIKIRTRCESFHHNFDKALKVNKCGIRLIYSQDLQLSHPSTTQTENTDDRICTMCQNDGMLRWRRCFKGSDINEVPIIENPSEVDRLCLYNCKNLTSLPSSLCDFSSLAVLSCYGCSKLERFPEIRQDMERLREIYLNKIPIKEIPSSVQRLRGLQYLFLNECKNLVNLPESICNLTSFKRLFVSGCPKFNKLPDNLGRLQSLEFLFVCNLRSRNFQLPSLSGLCSLKVLELHGCNLREIPSEICQLSSLELLNLKRNHFSCIPDGINQLYNLKRLSLSYCKMLQHIPQLPSSITYLDAHHCTSLENLFQCGRHKDQIQGLEVNSIVRMFVPAAGSNGIPRSISHQKNEFKITMELPWSWYENDDFLGFALCSLYGQSDLERMKTIKSTEYKSFRCILNLHNESANLFNHGIFSDHFNDCSYHEDESNRVWLIYYSKSNIPKKYHSNEWRTMTASFEVLYGTADPVNAERCGFQFLYAHDYDYDHNNPTIIIQGSNSSNSDVDLGGYRSVVQDVHNSTHHSQRRNCTDTKILVNVEEDHTSSSTEGRKISSCHGSCDTTQNIDDNDHVDGQDNIERDHIGIHHRWLELLGKFAHWICCTTH